MAKLESTINHNCTVKGNEGRLENWEVWWMDENEKWMFNFVFFTYIFPQAIKVHFVDWAKLFYPRDVFQNSPRTNLFSPFSVEILHQFCQTFFWIHQRLAFHHHQHPAMRRKYQDQVNFFIKVSKKKLIVITCKYLLQQ